MTDQGKLLVVHGACVLIIAALFALAGTVFRGQAVPAGLLVGLGFWLWGKLGFKPAQVVLERIVFQQLGVSLGDAKALTTRPPPMMVATAADGTPRPVLASDLCGQCPCEYPVVVGTGCPMCGRIKAAAAVSP